MENYKKLRIDISEIRQNGVLCENPVIYWITQEGLLYPCIGEDYIEIEAPPSTNGCVEFIVQCDDCSVCPPVHITRCLCDTSADCEECENCVDGWCVPLCPDQLCADNTCVDCVTDADCDPTEICLNGECTCPVDKPFRNERGECVACINNDNCGDCAICYDGECIGKYCGDGVCDPVTDQCVECLQSGDCTGINECCVDKKCQCCPGFIYDYTLQQCIKEPDCTTDVECKECEICVDGTCVYSCPDGTICVNGVCVPTCDCFSGECAGNKACIPYNGDVCICSACYDGNCINNDDCGEGCVCSGGRCTPSLCHGNCINGADCGNGCGCYNGECIECMSTTCDNDGVYCAEILGCECNQSNLCIKDSGGCVGNCTSSFDCGDGCTCYNGECVPCDWFSCEGTECSDRLGCQCVDGGCVDNPSDRVCDHTLTVTATNCDLTAQLSGIDECLCPNITADLRMTSVVDLQGSSPIPAPYRATFVAELRKGEGHPLTLPLLTDNHPDIAENEVPNTGDLILNIYETYKNKITNIAITPSSSPIASYTIDMSGKSTVTISNVDINKIGSTATVNEDWVVTSVVLEFKVSSILNFPNGCDYSTALIGNKTINGLTIINNTQTAKDGFTIYKALTSPDTRYPRITWYKSSTNVFSTNNIFRSLYVPLSVGGYIDVLYGMDEIPISGLYPLSGEQGELWNNYYYMVKADCSCVSEGSLGGKLAFCDPDDFSSYYSLDDCNRTITFLDFVPCDMNKDITTHEVGSYDIPDSSQTKYEVLINGVLFNTFVYQNGVGMVTYNGGVALNGLSKTYTDETITSVIWRIYHTTGDYVCTQTYTHDALSSEDIIISAPNCMRGDWYSVELEPTQVGLGTITDITVTSSTPNTVMTPAQTGDNWYLELDKHYVHTLLISVDIGGGNICKRIVTMPIPNCNLNVTLVMSDISCGGTLDLSTSTTGDTPPNNYLYRVPNPTQGGAPLQYTTETVSLQEGQYGNGQVTVDVTDSMGNTAQGTGNASRQTYVFSHPSTISVCAGDTYDIELTGSTGAEVATTIPGYGTVTLPITITLTAVADATYTYSTLTPAIGGCTFTLTDMETNVDVITQPTATMVSPSNPSCSSSNPAITITGGTPNATVYYTLDGIAGTKLLDSSGNGSILLPLSDGNHTIVKTKVKLGDCENNSSQSISVTVNASPTIYIYPNSYACSSDLATYEIEFSCASSNLSATQGVIASAGTNLWTLSGIPTGVASTITALNGVCTVTATTTAYDCDCSDITVTPPVPTYPLGQTSYYWCDNDPVIPTLVVNSGNQVDWYSAMSGGTLLLSNSLTYTPASLPVCVNLTETTIYYVEAVDLAGCKSSPRTPVTITRFQTPSIDVYPAANDYLCEGTKVTFYSNVYGGDDPYSYTWSLDNSNCAGCYIDGTTDAPTVVVGLGDTGDTFDLTLTIQDSSLNNCTEEYTYSGEVGSDCPIVPFILKIDTTEPGTATNQFQLTGADGQYDVSAIKDGQTTIQEFLGLTDQQTLTFTAGTGIYYLRIYPRGTGDPFHRIEFHNTGDRKKVLQVMQWGDVEWSSMSYAFTGCINLNGDAVDNPDLSSCTNLAAAFQSCTIFDSDISGWDTSNITTMSGMLAATAFNQDISGWDMTSVLNISYMFQDTTAFNQDIDNWDTTSITNMRGLFYGADAFNQDISSWDTSSVEDMARMFQSATVFNQNIGSWDTSSVEDMEAMFQSAIAFNYSINNWDVSNVTNMASMFNGASAFNQNLADWELHSGVTMSNFFKDTTALSCENYSETLYGWSANPSTPSSITMGASGAEYGTDAATDRAHLVSPTGLQWTITGDTGATGTCLIP